LGPKGVSAVKAVLTPKPTTIPPTTSRALNFSKGKDGLLGRIVLIALR
jgi:hypothetical protein